MRGHIQTKETRDKISKTLKGHLTSEETKRKIGEANKISLKGHHPINEWEKGHIPWNKETKGLQEFTKETRKKMSLAKKGIKFSEEICQKISKSKKGKHTSIKTEFQKGEKHIGWLDGKSFEPYGIDFNNILKLKIRKRDNFTCQECNFTEKQLGYKLGIHHIDYNKQNNNPDNLISLCKSCHSQTNYKRENWTNYFRNKLL